MSLEQKFVKLIEGVNCNRCNGRIIFDNESYEKICSSCGTVINYEHVKESESMNHTSQESIPEAVAESSQLGYEINLHSMIDNKNVDFNGKQINNHFEVERLRRLNRFTISNITKTRNLTKAVKEIQRIVEILGLSNLVTERAGYIYHKAFNGHLIRGRSITGIAAATVCIACKEIGLPHSMDQIMQVIPNANKRNIAYYYRFLIRQMKINMGLQKPESCLSRIAEKAGLSGKTERKALEILASAEGNAVLSGKKPSSLAAAALYLAAMKTGEQISQLRIAIAAELTTITIRKRASELDSVISESTQIHSDTAKNKNDYRDMKMIK